MKFPTLRQIVNGLLTFWTPELCFVCGKELIANEKRVCKKCLSELPRTGYEKYKANPAEKLFWGRAEIHSAFSGFFYRKNQILRKLVHEFKYHNNPEMAYVLGQELGRLMQKAGTHKDYDFLVPVPLHPQKIKIRGYNQSLYLAKGISDITKLDVNDTLLIRAGFSESQTKKNRFDRWTGVENNFVVSGNATRYAGIRLLLVDDVLTTGATLEACYNALAQIPHVRVGIATLGKADNG